MSPGDSVVYSADHHRWLVSAGRWPLGLGGRHRCVGTVEEVDDRGRVMVIWPSPQAPVARLQLHFPENLEVCS
jgi:hypothetical protein